MNIYDMFRTDAGLEKSGVWLDYGPFRILVARAGGSNIAFQRILAAKLKPYRRQIEMGTMDEGQAKRLLAETYAESVVLDWEGVTDETGTPLEFSKDNVVKILIDLPDLFRDIQDQAGSLAVFRAQGVQEVAKN